MGKPIISSKLHQLIVCSVLIKSTSRHYSSSGRASPGLASLVLKQHCLFVVHVMKQTGQEAVVLPCRCPRPVLQPTLG